MTGETIVAIATPPGRGGLGVVRLSGDLAFTIVHSLFPFRDFPPPRRATLAGFNDPETGWRLDDVIITCFAKPHSYTGEDVVEISCHGAPVVLRFLVDCCVAKGARPAEPGEFTERAFLNGRLDLTQAEAVRDLIESRTLFQARVAARQLQGSVSARVKPWKAELVDLIARIEAGIDFAEDDVPVAGAEVLLAALDSVGSSIRKMVEGYSYGRIVREGLSLAIVGRPNVGKSSLFNRLLNEDRAIVTEIPGTTRDFVTESASFEGIPVRLADTAGIRESHDVVEKLGIERSLQALADADLRLFVLDASVEIADEDAKLIRDAGPHGAMVIACNKCDLPVRLSLDSARRLAAEAAGRDLDVVRTSAVTGEGLALLKEKIVATAAGQALDAEGDFITNARHQQILQNSASSIAKAREAVRGGIPHEMLLLDLYDALHALDALTGATSTDDVLGVIFRSFCVGK